MKSRQWASWLMIWIVLVFALWAGSARAADVEVKYSGPSGQGDIIYYAPAGQTNMVLTSEGIVNARFHIVTRFDGDIYFYSNVVVSGAVTFTSLDIAGNLEANSIVVVTDITGSNDITVLRNSTFGSGAGSTSIFDSATWDITGAGVASGFSIDAAQLTGEIVAARLTNALPWDAANDWTGTLDGEEGEWYVDAVNQTGTLSSATVPAAQLSGEIAAARLTNALPWDGVDDWTGTFDGQDSPYYFDAVNQTGTLGTATVPAAQLSGEIAAARMTNALPWDGTSDWTGTLDGQEGAWYVDAVNQTGTLSTATVPAAQLSGEIAAARLTNALPWDGTSDWTGTFDGQEGAWYVDAVNQTGTLSTASVPAAQLTGEIAAARMTNALPWDAANDWTGTFDGQEGAYYFDAANQTGTLSGASVPVAQLTGMGLTTNQQFESAEGVTNTFVFTNGILYGVN